MPKAPKKTPASIAALNALDLALESQKFEAETEEMLQAVLPLLDAVERVCRNLDLLEREAALGKVEAIAMLAELAEETAGRLGVERTGRIGDTADPSRHEIVEVVSQPGVPAGIIVDVLRFGWIYHGRTLRPAQVVVSAPAQNEARSNETGPGDP